MRCLLLIGCCLLTACSWKVEPKPFAGDPMSAKALYADVELYAGHGIHRAGGDGDRDTTEWLGRELARAGYDVKLDPVRFNRFDLEEARFEVDGKSLECLPFWFPKATDGPITAPLAKFDPDAPGDLTGKIVVADAPEGQWKFDPMDWVMLAHSKGAAALVIVVPSRSGDVLAQNAIAPFNQAPRNLPLLNVAIKHRDFLFAAVDAGKQATLEVRGTSNSDAQTNNIVAKIDRGGEWIVVTTPITGWYTCGGERGPGVALFLGLARWFAEKDVPYSLMFLGNAGHELAQMGAGDTLEKNAPAKEDVKVWLHLGASIATREIVRDDAGNVQKLDSANTIGNLVATEALLPSVQAAFANVDFYVPRSTPPIRGELYDFIEADYNAFGFFGGCYYFHTPYDAADSTTPELLKEIGDALQAFFNAL